MKFTIFSRFLLLAGIAFAIASCSNDDTPDPSSLPFIQLVDEAGFVSGEAALVTPGNTIDVKVSATKGDSPLNSFTIFADDLAVSLDSISVNGAPASANPVLLFNADQDMFEYEISISPDHQGLKTYKFEVSDEDGNNESVSIDITIAEGLSITVNDDDNIFNTTLGVPAAVNVTVTQGLGDLFDISVTDDAGNPVDAAELSFLDQATVFDANPFTIPDDNKTGFTGDIFITGPAEPGDYIYTIAVTDVDLNEASATITLRNGTPLDGDLSGVLFNAGGPMGTGGLDLDNGDGTGSSDAAAEIRDEGIDLAQPMATNWKQEISGINTSTLRSLDMNSLPETFTFDAVNNQEIIKTAYDTGNNLTDNKTKVEAAGEMYAIYNSNNDRYYLIRVDEVNVVTTNNDDNYVLSIKY